jgi:hypothetical protein
VRHGEWLAWLEANFSGSERTARNYMRLAENRQQVADSRQQVADLSTVREAVAALTRAQEVDQAAEDADTSAPRTEADHARSLLVTADAAQVRDLVYALPDEALTNVLMAAHTVAGERRASGRAEHQTEPTFGEVMGEDRFDPAANWADTIIIRVNNNARELAGYQRLGLMFGTMTPEQAFGYLEEAERLIADVRAEAQERLRDAKEYS